MKLFIYLFIILIPKILSGQIILSEIMFNPEGSEHINEFIEIYNMNNSASIDLGEWQIGDQDGLDQIIDAGHGLILKPNQYGLIFDMDYFESEQVYQSFIPKEACLFSIEGNTLGSGGLSNSRNETIRLVDPQQNCMASITYTVDNLSGYSEEKIDLSQEDIESNWRNSKILNGTPGFRNSIAKLNYDLSISEIKYVYNNNATFFKSQIANIGFNMIKKFNTYFFVDINQDSMNQESEIFSTTMNLQLAPDDSLQVTGEWVNPILGVNTIGFLINCPEDENSDNNVNVISMTIPTPEGSLIINEIMATPINGVPEWIELYNPNSSSVNLQEFYLSDEDTSKSKKITEDICILEPFQFLILSSMPISRKATSAKWIQLALPSLNNDTDAIYIFDNNHQVIDYTHYENSDNWEAGYSLERIQTIRSSQDPQNWMPCVDPTGSTPGHKNSVAFDQLPDVCQLEINPNPFSPDNDGIDDEVMITYYIPDKQCRATLTIFDIRGRHVITLLEGARSGASQSVCWNGIHQNGKLAEIGIYIVYFQAIDDISGLTFEKKETVVLAKQL